jgi:hypothetical protein
MAKMRSKRQTLIAVTLVTALSAAPIVQAGFLADLDKAMKNYGDNITKTGDNNLATMKTVLGHIKKGEFKQILPAVDAGMKTYGGDMQKTGDDALVDLKAIIKDLLDPKTYLPGPLKKAWEAFVAELAVLKARFLRRVENPWADDPPAGGGAGGETEPAPPADPPPADPPADPPPADPPPSPAPPAPPEGGGDTPPPTGASAETGELPEQAAASSTRKAGGVVGVDGMNEAFSEFVGVREVASKAHGWNQSEVPAASRTAVGSKVTRMVAHAREMEDKLFKKLSRNATAMKAFLAFCAKKGASAKAQCGQLLDRLAKSWNAQAMRDRSNAAKAELAKAIAKFKSK